MSEAANAHPSLPQVQPLNSRAVSFASLVASDGSPLAVTQDAAGDPISISGTGTDGLARELTITRVSRGADAAARRPYAATTYTFADGGTPYFTFRSTLTSNGQFILGLNLWAGAGATVGEQAHHAVEYDFAFFDQVLQVQWLQPGKPVTRRTYPLPFADNPLPTTLDDAAVLSGPLPVFPSLDQAFGAELRRARYFTPWFRTIDDDFRADVAASRPETGINPAALPGLQFIKLTAPTLPGTPPSGPVTDRMEALSKPAKSVAKAIVAGLASLVVFYVFGGTGTLVDWGIRFLVPADASLIRDLIDTVDAPTETPPSGGTPADMGVSADMGVPTDMGVPMSDDEQDLRDKEETAEPSPH